MGPIVGPTTGGNGAKIVGNWRTVSVREAVEHKLVGVLQNRGVDWLQMGRQRRLGHERDAEVAGDAGLDAGAVQLGIALHAAQHVRIGVCIAHALALHALLSTDRTLHEMR